MESNDLRDIDPALGGIGELARIGGGTVGHLRAMRQHAINTDGALPARFKALSAVLWSISARCEPCIRYYVTRARALGATEAELGEILAVAATMGGCVGETWALKALAAFHAASGNVAGCC